MIINTWCIISLTQVKHRNKGLFLSRYITGDKTNEHNLAHQLENNIKRRNQAQRKNSIVLCHTIINWAPGTTGLNDTSIKKIAESYLKDRCPKTPAMVTIHDEPNKIQHIHILHSTNTIAGNTNRLSKKQFAQCKVQVQKLEQELEICGSEVDHQQTKIKTHDAEHRIKQRGFSTHKDIIRDQIQHLYAQSVSDKTFFKALEKSNIHIYTRYGKVAGIILPSNKRLRLSGLGFDQQKILELNISYQRLLELNNADKNKEHDKFKH